MNASVVADDELRGPEDSNDRHECEDQDEDDFAEWDCRTGGGHVRRAKLGWTSRMIRSLHCKEVSIQIGR